MRYKYKVRDIVMRKYGIVCTADFPFYGLSNTRALIIKISEKEFARENTPVEVLHLAITMAATLKVPETLDADEEKQTIQKNITDI